MIAGVIGLICFGPWGLLVGAVALIIGLWPKYKGMIMATVAAIGVALLAIYSGPVGWVIAGVTALFALVWAFKDKIWGWIEGIGGFIWGAVKSIGALVGKALLFMLLGPIRPLMAAWAVIRKFFPSMGEKIKGAVFGLLSKIPFVGKFFKGKSGEGDGDSEAAEAKANTAQPKGAAVKPDVKPPEAFSGVPAAAPKPEVSPVTRYSAPAAKPAGPVQLPPDVVEKLTSAVRSVRTANLAAAASIIREMKALAAKRAAGVSVSVVNVNNVSVSVANRGEAGVKAALGRLSARVAFVMRAVNTMRNSAGAALARLSAIARSVRGVPFIIGRVRLAVQPIIALMHRMSQQLTMINGSIRLSSASGSLMGTVASAVSQAKSIVGGAFSRVAGAFGLWKGEESSQPNPAQLAVGAARTQKAIPDAPEGSEAIVVSGAAAGADVEKSPKGRYEGRDWAVRYVKEKLRRRREARQRMLERDVPDSSLEGAMATMNEIAQIQRENADALSGEGGDALGPEASVSQATPEAPKGAKEMKAEAAKGMPKPEASADAVGAGPLVGQKDEIEANGASANAANVNSLVSQKNVIESMKAQGRQISNENREKAQSVEDGREEKRMAMLPAAICAGLEAFFDGRELTLKGAHEPENILEIGKEDRADDF